ncbi:unnamed protein product [Acanthosepion pharaonis]|uniref:Uncharacterized protein n=1 Tax=Acanthosepion pharaonis TaxID=158019 RepID=A0A812C0N1_ACAPH|nr:unnamed protein product [Sepia pharaonis]
MPFPTSLSFRPDFFTLPIRFSLFLSPFMFLILSSRSSRLTFFFPSSFPASLPSIIFHLSLSLLSFLPSSFLLFIYFFLQYFLSFFLSFLLSFFPFLCTFSFHLTLFLLFFPSVFQSLFLLFVFLYFKIICKSTTPYSLSVLSPFLFFIILCLSRLFFFSFFFLPSYPLFATFSPSDSPFVSSSSHFYLKSLLQSFSLFFISSFRHLSSPLLLLFILCVTALDKRLGDRWWTIL